MHDKSNFKSFLDKACLFSQYIDDNANNNFQYQSCISGILHHRVEQLTSGEFWSDAIKLSDFANIGKVSQKGAWIFGCDQSFSCTAIGFPNMKNTYDKGQYIAIHWQYNSKNPPHIRIVVASDDKKITKVSFHFQFENNQLAFPFRYEEVGAPIILSVRIAKQASSDFLNSLLKEKYLIFGVDYKDLPRSQLALADFSEFYKAQQENAKFLYGDKIPTLPRLDARSFSLQSQLKQADPSISNCQSQNMPVLNIQFNDQQAFIANCEDIASNDNAYYRLQKQTENTILGAQFDGKAHLLGQNWLFDPVANKNNLELHSRQIFSPNNDCGRDYGFAYNGKVWQLSFFRAMPFCDLIQQEDWPVLYQSQIAH